MMARETASNWGPPPFLDSRESFGSALRLATGPLCTTYRQFCKARSMKFVVFRGLSCGFRRCGAGGGVENVSRRFRVGVSELGQLDTFRADTSDTHKEHQEGLQ
ncbi:hypothetical protein GCM10010297_47010 [Streptomyces malachitofuscus]|nr:hypothetical protein GCM10010297_47010 [Streptomyces malachitofuscus]